jgi:L-rhamnose mutarotase
MRFTVKRMGMVIQLKANKIKDYKRLHASVWPDVLKTIAKANIRNYTIFLREPENLLFGYWEYHGDDFEADSAKIASDPKTQEWWKITDALQIRMESSKPNEQWSMMDEVFHTD